MYLKPILITVASLSFLSACLSDNDDSPTPAAPTAPVSVLAASGAMAVLEGTFTRPCDSRSATDSEQNTVTISGNTWNNVWNTYGTADCSGTIISVGTYTATLTVDGTGAITGWVDDSDVSVVAPAAADGLGSTLSDTASYSTLTVTFTAINAPNDANAPTVGQSANTFYIVDDTGTGLILYGYSGSNGVVTNPLTSVVAP